MNRSQKLHTEIRRFCAERYEFWITRYSKPSCINRIIYRYTDKQYDIFPRYNTHKALLGAVQAFDYDSLPEYDEFVLVLKKIGYEYEDDFIRNPSNDIALKAIVEERELFIQFIEECQIDDHDFVKPLPYLFVCDVRIMDVTRKFLKEWKVGDSYYFPLDLKARQDLIAFSSSEFDDAKGQSMIRSFLKQMDVQRIYALKEADQSYIIDACAEEFYYDGNECFWFDCSLAWMIYCSHEGSITIGGTSFIQHIQSKLPSWKEMVFP